MWQRFTERARRIVFYAQEEAGRWGENYVATEHLLLGMLREPEAVSGRILVGLGFDLEHIREVCESKLTPGDGKTGQDMQLTPRAKQVVDLAYDEARLLDNNYIGTEHLLLGLIREGEGMAGQVLAQVGVQLEPVRVALRELQDQTPQSKQAAEKKATRPFGLKKKKGSETEPAASPSSEIAESLPRKGDLGVLQNEDGRQEAELITSEESVTEFLDVLLTKDPYAYREMIAAGKILILPVGTEVKFLRADNICIYMRVLSGDHAGKTGWVRRCQFQRTGPDDRPFPPPVTPPQPSPS